MKGPGLSRYAGSLIAHNGLLQRLHGLLGRPPTTRHQPPDPAPLICCLTPPPFQKKENRYGKRTTRTLSGFMELLPPAGPVRPDGLHPAGDLLPLRLHPLDTPSSKTSKVLLAPKRQRDGETDLPLSQGETPTCPSALTSPSPGQVCGLEHGQAHLPFRRFRIGKVYREGQQGLPGVLSGGHRRHRNGALDISNEAGESPPSSIRPSPPHQGTRRFQIRVNNRKILNGFFTMLGLSQQSGESCARWTSWTRSARTRLAELLVQSGLSPEQAQEILSFYLHHCTSREVLTALEGLPGPERGL